jgi:hypothetical protein
MNFEWLFFLIKFYFFILRFKPQLKSINGQPASLTAETLVVAELSVYNMFQKFFGISDQGLTFEYMRVYFSHTFTGVNLRYQNSLAKDPDLRITIRLTNFLFLTVT